MNKYERRAIAFLIVLSLGIIYYSLNKLSLGTVKEPGPGFFPFISGAGVLILCFIWFAMNPKVKACEALWKNGTWLAPAIAMVIIILYTFGLDTLGYCVSTFIFLIAWQRAIVHEKWVRTGIVAVIGTVAMYVLFGYLLGVPLPEGLLI